MYKKCDFYYPCPVLRGIALKAFLFKLHLLANAISWEEKEEAEEEKEEEEE